MNGLALSDSPITKSNYRFNRRLAFLYGALRTRSLFARQELGRLGETSQLARLDLAWLISNQASHESDLKLAFEHYQAQLAQAGWRAFKHMHLADLSILATKLGQHELAREAASRTKNLLAKVSGLIPRSMPTIPMQGIQEAMHATLFFSKDYSVASEFLKVDVANPLRGLSKTQAQAACELKASREWLGRLNRELFHPSLEPLEFSPAQEPWQTPFDLLGANCQPASVSGPKVTVVISTFHPDESLLTAVRSTLNQTYGNLEILVIDDCSPAAFNALLSKVAMIDPRITVLRQRENGGTYRIRNRALDEATGEFITFQDSDDYMHPRRIELQVKHLLANPKKVANISLSTRLTERLEAVESNRRLRIGLCEPSLLFRRATVRDRIGYFDSVRKSADSEYRKRIMKAFNQDCDAIHPFRILTVQRADNGGLTQGELGFRWITEFRLIYRDCYLNFHRGSGPWRIERDGERKFYAPRYSLMPGAEARAAGKFDLVLIANLRDAKQIPAVVARVKQAAAEGKRVGLFQVNSLYPLNRKMGTIKPQIVELLNSSLASMVFARDEISCQKVEVFSPNTFAISYSGEAFAWKVASVEVSAAEEAFVSADVKPLLEQALAKLA